MNNDFDKIFAAALAKVPDMPDCYGNVMRRIQRKKMLLRTLWAVAAMLVVSVMSLMYSDEVKNRSLQPAVAEELQSIRSLVNGDNIREEMVSCSLIDGEMYYSPSKE
jgi:hypothetical protein